MQTPEISFYQQAIERTNQVIENTTLSDPHLFLYFENLVLFEQRLAEQFKPRKKSLFTNLLFFL